MKRILFTIAIIMLITITAIGQTGTYTAHDLFYLPKFGAGGVTEYNTYNDAMNYADGVIWGNKTAIEALQSSLGNFVTDLTSFTTDNLAEGNTNKYFPGFTSLFTDYDFTDNSSNWDTAYGWGDWSGEGFITINDIPEETDPIFTDSDAYNITSGDISNWDTAYGWGDHSLANYLTDISGFDTDDLAEGSTNKYFPGFNTLPNDYNFDPDDYISVEIIPLPVKAGQIIETYNDDGTIKFDYIDTPTGVESFIGLDDTPDDYDDAENLFLKVNNNGDALEFSKIYEADITDLGTYLTSETDPTFTSSPAYLIPTPTAEGKILETYQDGEVYKFKYITTPEGGSGSGASDLSDLGDVALGALADGEVLKYSSSSQKWVNAEDENTTYSAGTGLKLTGTTFSSTITQYTDNLAISAIKNDNDWNASNWDTAYGWGDHSTKGYLTTESDPVFTSSVASGITSTNISNWNTAHGWGNHSSAGYLKGIANENIDNLKNVNITSPTSGQVLKYNGTNWINSTDNDTKYSAGTGMSLNGTTFNCDVVDTNTTYSAGTGMSLSGTTFNCTVTDTNTTYTAGDGLKLTGTQFSLDFKYDPSIASGEYSGIPDTGIVGETVLFGDLLYFKWSDKKYYKAKADNPATAEVTAIAVEGKGANQSCTIIRQGYVSFWWHAFTDSIVYLSPSRAGEPQSTIPNNSGDQIKRVGHAVDTFMMFFNPSQDIGEVK